MINCCIVSKCFILLIASLLRIMAFSFIDSIHSVQDDIRNILNSEAVGIISIAFFFIVY
jgi:hypothetical protein